MTKFLVRVFLAISLLIGLLVAAAMVGNQKNACQGFLGAFLDKQQRLENLHSPRLIFVGGSNLAFGLDSQKVAQHFDRETINLSTHAGLGLKFMLDSLNPHVQAGDTLVVIPEYAQFSDTFWGKQELASLVLDVYPNGWKHLNWRQRIYLMPAMATYCAKDLFAQIQRRPFPKLPGNESVYRRDAFNENGDVQVHWDLPSIEIQKAAKLYKCPRLDAFAFEYVSQFRTEIQQRGARLILLPPVYRMASFENQWPLIDGVDNRLRETGCEFQSGCQRYCFDNDLFFDSHYHLTRQGTQKRTEMVIEDLIQLGVK